MQIRFRFSSDCLALIIHCAGVAWVCAAFSSAAISAEPSIQEKNVLVLYNDDDGPTGCGSQIANYYKSLRPGVHLAPITGVNPVLMGAHNEWIAGEDYLNIIRPQVLAAIASSPDPIDVIVTTKGLPLRIDAGTKPSGNTSLSWRRYSSLESELTRVDTIDSIEQMGDQFFLVGLPNYDTALSSNPYYNHQVPFDRAANEDIRLSSRLDGYNVQNVRDSLEHAQKVIIFPSQDYLVADDDPTAGTDQMVDTPPGQGGGGPGPGLVNAMVSGSVELIYDNTDDAVVSAPGPVIGYVSHGSNDGSGGLEPGYILNQLQFQLADGAVFLTHESYNATSFDPTYTQSQGLIAQWIEAGGAAGLGHVAEPYDGPDNVTNEDLFYETLIPSAGAEPGSSGLTFVEAAWNATRQLSYVNTMIGDPLMVWETWVPGDFNLDGAVDQVDTNLFVLALVNRKAFNDLELGINPDVLGDLNGSGSFDLGDVNAFLALIPTPEPILGDMNNDGFVNHADYNPFVLALVNRLAYDAKNYGVDAELVGDIDGSGDFNLGDVGAFIDLLTLDGPLRGDMNGDGLVNENDVTPFVLGLTNAAAYEEEYPLLDRIGLGDVNKDGRFNLGDVSLFKQLVASGGLGVGTAVPEPTGSTLLLFGVSATLLFDLCWRQSARPRLP